MSRFEQELSGVLGPFWQRSAEQELTAAKADLEAGRITVDENGVARNSLGRALMEDQLERLVHVTDKANVAATNAARRAEVAEALASYRAARRPHSPEELAEMRAAFGPGATVRDILTGEEIHL